MSTAKSRFRRRGDQNAGETGPGSGAPAAAAVESAGNAANEVLGDNNILENVQPSPQQPVAAQQQPLIDESLFPAFGARQPAGGIEGTFLANGDDNEMGFGHIPQRNVPERGDSDLEISRAKSRENSMSSRQRRNNAPDRDKEKGSESGILSCFGNNDKVENNNNNKKENKAPNSVDNQSNQQSNADNSKQETELAKPTNDLPRYYRRMEYLKSLQQSFMIYPFYKCSRMLWMGYDNEEFKRVVPFSKAYPSLDLSAYSRGWTLGIVLRTIDTFRQNIIGLVKPIVKVHVLDIETGMYVKSADMPPTRPVFTTATSATESGSSAKWDEEVVFEANYADIVSEKSVLLFEIIDERPFLSTGRRSNKRKHHYKKIAWGYLLPIGTDGRLNVGLANRIETNGEVSINRANPSENSRGNKNEGGPDESNKVPKLVLPTPEGNPVDMFESMKSKDVNLRIQLHYYREYDGLIGLIQRSVLTWPSLNTTYESAVEANYPTKVPPIYLQWRMLRKQQVDGAFLRISIGSRAKKPRKTDDTHRTMESEPEPAGPTTARSKKDVKTPNKGKKKRRKVRSKEERTKLRAAAMRRTRGPKDPCIIPDKFLNRIEVGPEGAMVVAFSNSGHALAIASRMFAYHGTGVSPEIIYSLRLYDTDLNEEIWVDEVAHHSIIYDLKWSKNDRFLISCSGDGTCKVWDFLSFSPSLSQYSTAYYAHQTAINRNRATGAGGDDDTYIGTQMATARTANTYNTAGNHTGVEFHPHDEMSPANIAKMYPPQVIQVLPLAAHVVAYCTVLQEFSNTPFVLPSPAMQFKDDALTMGELNYYIEQLNVLKASNTPRVIVGCSDGRIRVFDSGRFMGYVMVNDKDDSGNQKDFSPHDGVVNALAIDERSKYLISADSFGDILAWRLDGKGWYQLLRKFKRDVGLNDPALLEQFDNGSVLSLSMHPDKLKGLMLVLSRQPSVLRVVNMSTYKPLSYCEGFTGISANVVREDDDSFSTGVFHRAQFTADGKFIACCVQDTQNKQHFRLMFWETFTGHLVPSPLSKMTFPYPIRSITWHPMQHLVAIAMTGPGAAVNLYSADQDSPMEAHFFGTANTSPLGMMNALNGAGDDPFRRSTNSLSRSVTSLGAESQVEGLNKSPEKKINLPTIAESQSSKSLADSGESESKEARAARTKAILEKVRAARAAKQG